MQQPKPTNRNTLIIRLVDLLACFIIALIPRTTGLADFLTTDEVYHWIDRSQRFSQATTQYRWHHTILTGHPGVTTMWLGSLGLHLEALLGGAVTNTPAVLEHLAWLRLPGTILHAFVIAICYVLISRLLGRRVALIASMLWATAPYLIAHGRLLHLDANLTDFVTLSLLVLLNAYRQQRAWKWLIVSGLCTGLALLTKGPALILLPFCGLVMFGLQPAGTKEPDMCHNRLIWALLVRLQPSIKQYLLWLAVAALVVVALWPAMWVVPGEALTRYWGEITDNGGRPNGDGQFFWGSANADPGLLFYPIANAFRTTPVMLLGLGLALVFGVNALHRNWRVVWSTTQPRTILILVGFVCFWTLIMSLGPKKFDRYVLPTWPSLIILAAIGWDALLRRTSLQWLHVAILSIGLACELAILAWYHPYYLSYYNPLFGGGAVAQRTFLIGWGEGMDQVGAYLRSRPDLSYGPVLSALGPTLQPFVPVDVRDVDDYGKLPANYAVVYLESVQRAANPALYAQLQTTLPLHTVTIHGIEYATIYQLPRPFTTPSTAHFGEALWLRGFTLQRTATQLTIIPAWDVRAMPDGEYHVFVHLIAPNGQRVSQIDLAPGGGDAASTRTWQPGQQISVPLPLDLSANLPRGEYQLVLGVYDIASNTRLPLTGGEHADPAIAGNDALLVERIVVR